MVLVWEITDDLLNFPLLSFPAISYSVLNISSKDWHGKWQQIFCTLEHVLKWALLEKDQLKCIGNTIITLQWY